MIELGARKMELDLEVLDGARDEEFVDRFSDGERRILFDRAERLLLDGGLTRTVGLLFLRTGVLSEGWLDLDRVEGVLVRGRVVMLGGRLLDLDRRLLLERLGRDLEGVECRLELEEGLLI